MLGCTTGSSLQSGRVSQGARSLGGGRGRVPSVSMVESSGVAKSITALLVSGNTVAPPLGFGHWDLNFECGLGMDQSEIPREIVQISARALRLGVAIPRNVRRRLQTASGSVVAPNQLLLGSGEFESDNGL